jgi:hypothetical protein
MAVTIKIAPEIDAKLWKKFTAVAEKNGQSQRHLLESALEFYLHHVVPSHRTVRPEVMEASRRSNQLYRELYERLAKGK